MPLRDLAATILRVEGKPDRATRRRCSQTQAPHSIARVGPVTQRANVSYLAVATTASAIIAGDASGAVWFLDTEVSLASMEQRLLTQFASYVKALDESVARHVSIIDDKYKDLPSRVKRPETAVFRPTRR